jgi:probable F420-dependent oxidoreductase
MKPFRFGIETPILPQRTWREDLRFIEEAGYSSILWTDHFGSQWNPTVSMATTAALTSRLKTGTMVYCVDFHHPAVLAQKTATAQLLSRGRIEFGIGAGWLKADYEQTGIPYDKPATRIKRMEEAIKIIKSMWTGKTTFKGKYYQIKDIPSPSLEGVNPPPILVGGGGKMILSVAGRHANIVNIISGLLEGKFTSDFYRRGVIEGYKSRVNYVKEAALKAGRSFEDIELSIATTHTQVTDDPEKVYSSWAKSRGLSIGEAKAIPTLLVGNVNEIKDKLYNLREITGANYIVLGLPNIEEIREFGEHIVKDMTGK